MDARDIFIICNDVDGLGGVQRFSHTLGTILAERGHRVRLVGIVRPEVTHDYGDDQPYDVLTIHDTRPPRVVSGKWWRRHTPGAALRKSRRARFIRRGARRLSVVFAAAQPGSVIICTQVWAMEWLSVADTHGIPVIGMSHESFAASKATGRYGRVRRYFADVDRLLVLTQADADMWANNGMSNVGAMPNPLTLAVPEPSKLTEKVVIGLGRLSHEKGFDLLVEAWALVAPKHPDWEVRVYGSGPEDEELSKQIANAGLESSFHLMGQIQRVARALHDASIFVMPSRAEGWPLALGEAMASGLPCVAFDCAPSIRELLTDGEDSIVVPPGRVGDLAEAIDGLIGDAQRRRAMGAHALAAADRFTSEAIADRWEQEFTNLFR